MVGVRRGVGAASIWEGDEDLDARIGCARQARSEAKTGSQAGDEVSGRVAEWEAGAGSGSWIRQGRAGKRVCDPRVLDFGGSRALGGRAGGTHDRASRSAPPGKGDDAIARGGHSPTRAVHQRGWIIAVDLVGGSLEGVLLRRGTRWVRDSIRREESASGRKARTAVVMRDPVRVQWVNQGIQSS